MATPATFNRVKTTGSVWNTKRAPCQTHTSVCAREVGRESDARSSHPTTLRRLSSGSAHVRHRLGAFVAIAPHRLTETFVQNEQPCPTLAGHFLRFSLVSCICKTIPSRFVICGLTDVCAISLSSLYTTDGRSVVPFVVDVSRRRREISS